MLMVLNGLVTRGCVENNKISTFIINLEMALIDFNLVTSNTHTHTNDCSM
jgi:hypothetical protein